MNKKKSQAPIVDMISSFAEHGLAPLEDDAGPTISKDYDDNLINEAAETIPKLKAKETEKLIIIAKERCKPWEYADRSDDEMEGIEELAT